MAKNWASPTSQSTHSPEWLPSHHSLQVAIQISSGGTRCLAGSASEARATHRYNCEDSAAVSARTPRPRRKKPAIKKYSGGCTLFVECRCLTLAVHKTVRYHLKAKLKQPRPRSEKQLPGAVESFKKTPETSCSLTGVTINSVSMLGRFVTLCADESRVVY